MPTLRRTRRSKKRSPKSPLVTPTCKACAAEQHLAADEAKWKKSFVKRHTRRNPREKDRRKRMKILHVNMVKPDKWSRVPEYWLRHIEHENLWEDGSHKHTCGESHAGGRRRKTRRTRRTRRYRRRA
jgi:hypothetical protein